MEALQERMDKCAADSQDAPGQDFSEEEISEREGILVC